MDVDLHGLRAFVATAEEMHFGRAAERLYLSQQALSKRVRRLEEALGQPLFERTTRRVELTPAGRRLLPRAREALAAVDAAVDAVRERGGRLRVDVFDERFSPLGVLRGLLDRDPGLRIEPSMRQGLANALPAVQSREIDAAFGQVHDLGAPPPPELTHRLSHVRPMHAFVGAAHPLAGREEMRPEELRDAGIVMPDPGDATEARGFLTRLAGRFGIPIRFTEPAVGQRHYGEIVSREGRAVALGEESIEVPRGSGLHRIRLVAPVPLAPWSVVWHRDNRNPQLRRMLRLLGEPDLPARDDPAYWLPEPYRLA
ncbi:LysR family transcriptional regulator [Spirillospora sp. NPDC047279]|uniref:LysR family transcriptional regulator n=1 Tax=Spirillospora sp. NPDC047279 TaxID=3155478 RepID=UPI0033CAED24